MEQVRTIDKHRLKEKICSVDKVIMEQVDVALEISMGLRFPFAREEEHSNDRTERSTGRAAQ